MKSILIAIVCLLLVTGCATQSVDKTDKDGVHTRYRTTAIFNKTAFSGVAVDSETKGGTKKLLSVGTYGAETQTESVKALFDGLQGLFEAGFKAGAKAVVP